MRHHHEDDATRFKRRSFNAIIRRKKIAAYLKIVLTVIAAILVMIAIVLTLIT